MGNYYEYQNQNDDFEIEGVVVLDDLETFSKISSSRVIIFEDTSAASKAIEDMEKNKDIGYAYKAALSGDAEEVSIEKLVKFYIQNS